jgi:hypothetical protein
VGQEGHHPVHERHRRGTSRGQGDRQSGLRQPSRQILAPDTLAQRQLDGPDPWSLPERRPRESDDRQGQPPSLGAIDLLDEEVVKMFARRTAPGLPHSMALGSALTRRAARIDCSDWSLNSSLSRSLGLPLDYVPAGRLSVSPQWPTVVSLLPAVLGYQVVIETVKLLR